MEPYAWKDRPALIEHLFPAGKISVESYKEQMSNTGKILTKLGSYWKGRKPLILNKACILGSLLPVSNNPLKDLKIFEMLMGMDWESITERILAKLPARCSYDLDKIIKKSFREQIESGVRPEELDSYIYNHIWDSVNAHLGTDAHSFPELIEQMGIARFGHRPKIADVFCGSGQIPFEAARLGCDVYASDLNPIACLLTWSAFNVIGGNEEAAKLIQDHQKLLVQNVRSEILSLDMERNDGDWHPKFYLYCNEVKCPVTGWTVPILASKIISKDWKVVIDLIPNHSQKRYDIEVKYLQNKQDLIEYYIGTYKSGMVTHCFDQVNNHIFKISTVRGDAKIHGETKNNLRMWEKSDVIPSQEDIFQERLYCILWISENGRAKNNAEFRSVTEDDIKYEDKVNKYVADHITDWQETGLIPSMRIESGYNTDQPIRERGWTHWHHLFNPRQLLIAALVNKYSNALSKYSLCSVINWNSRLSPWDRSQIGGGGSVKNTFYNQALNTLFDYGCRSCDSSLVFCSQSLKHSILNFTKTIQSHPADQIKCENDIYITDPPYGDAVKYEEITEFFIAWLQKNPPEEFSKWTWDSRRPLAITGQGEDFRQKMIAAYTAMREHMPDNGIQILMFTHKSGSLWADLTNIIWASGLQVTAAWCVTTESDAAIRQGANIKSTVILVLRKRQGSAETYRDELAEEIEEEVEKQIQMLTGLDQKFREERSEGLYADADLQMAGYAAALKVLTAYSTIDGKDMVFEAKAPKVNNAKGVVDELIAFAEMTAVQFLVPNGFQKEEWKKLEPIERFYCKMAELEAKGEKTLDNYQRFAKAFKVKFADQVLSELSKANAARLKLGLEMKGNLMTGNYEIVNTPLRAILYASYELENEIEINDVLSHLTENYRDFFVNKDLVMKIARFLANNRSVLKPSATFHVDKEASNLSVLSEAIQRM